MRKLFLLIWLCCICCFQFYASIKADTLYITRKVDTIAFMPVHMCTFSQSLVYQRQNTNYHLLENDTLQLTIVNTDSLDHSFTIDGILTSGNVISPSDTAFFELVLPNDKSYAYYSDYAYGKDLGASGIIIKGYENRTHYFWNLFDQDTTLSFELATGLSASAPTGYRPNIFTINNLHHPNTVQDPDQKITNNVGDSIIIVVNNSGKMNHNFHFHGYHVKILASSMNNNQVGWDKDSFPVLRNELLTLLLVPDQPGIYPVHNHNLVALTTGAYPGGMLTRIEITP